MDEQPRDRLEPDDQPTVPAPSAKPPSGSRAPLPDFLDPLASSLYPDLPGSAPPPPADDATATYPALAIAVGTLPRPKPRPLTVLGVIGGGVVATLIFIAFFTALGGRNGFFSALFALTPHTVAPGSSPVPGGGLVSPQATSPAHTPVAIATMSPTVAPSPTVSPSPTPNVLSITITCASYSQASAQAQVCVQTTPHAALTIKVIDCDNNRQDFNAKPANTFANNSGAYTWTWNPRRPHGCNTASVTVTATIIGQPQASKQIKLTLS